MNFLKRSFTSIFRKPGKSIILLVLVFALCNVMAGAVSIKNALNMTKRSLLEQLGAEVRIAVDYDWIFNEAGEDFDFSSIGKIDQSIVEQLSRSNYVKRADYTITKEFEGDGICYAEAAEDIEFNGRFQTVGGNQTMLSEVEKGDIQISEGRMYGSSDIEKGAAVALISDKLAERNNLAVGDKISLIFDITQINTETYEIIHNPVKKEFEIIGLFTGIPKPGEETETYPANTIYTTTGAMKDFISYVKSEGARLGMDDSETNMFETVEASFIIDSIDNMEIFETESRSLLPLGYTFTDNYEKLSEVTKPMNNMKLIANIILYVAVGATVLVITLLITLFLKDRIREMGIYLSLGERKVKIATQIITEVMVVAVIAVTLSVFSGNLVAKQLSSGLLESQFGETQESGETVTYGLPGDGNDNVTGSDVINEYDVSLNPSTIGLIYLIGLGSVFVSALVPIVMTLQLKPRKIMM